jgi:hypothetical protein
MKKTLVLSLLVGAVTLPAGLEAQDPSACWLRGATAAEAMERPSPLGAVAIPLGDDTAQLCYGRPSARGREVAGNLIPFGEPWRMGANEPTQLHLPAPAQVGGVDLEPGVYSLFVIADEDEWEIVINSEYERWGIPINAEVRASDVGSVTRPVEETDEFVETFTIEWEAHGESMGHLVMEWENTHVELPIHGAGMSH